MSVNWNDAKIMERARQAAWRGVSRAITIVEQRAVDLIMDGPKTGAVYTTFFYTIGTGPTRRVIAYGSRPAHQASAPGEAPANDVGRLVNSRRLIPDEANLRQTLNFSTNYAIYLEKGTDRMEPRPYAVPALEHSRKAVIAAVQEEVAAEFKP